WCLGAATREWCWARSSRPVPAPPPPAPVSPPTSAATLCHGPTAGYRPTPRSACAPRQESGGALLGAGSGPPCPAAASVAATSSPCPARTPRCAQSGCWTTWDGGGPRARPGRAAPRHTGPYSSSSHASALPLASHSRQSDTWAEVQAWFHSSLCRGVCAGRGYLWASIICELGAYLWRPVLSALDLDPPAAPCFACADLGAGGNGNRWADAAGSG